MSVPAFLPLNPLVMCSNQNGDPTKLQKAARQRDGGVGTTVALNRVLFTHKELQRFGIAHLPPDDYRACHIREVLRVPATGSVIRSGVIDQFLSNDAPVEICDDLSVKVHVTKGKKRNLPPSPSISLLLAVPRPKVLARLLPQIVALGVKDIMLCNAYKVEKCYFDSTIIQLHEERNRLAIEGLCQSGVDARMPTVSVSRKLKAFLEDDLPVIVPDATHKFIAHPDSAELLLESLPQMIQSARESGQKSRIVIAVGPEGGWMPREVSMFTDMFGFQPISLGKRILRTDAAVLVLLGMLNQMTTLMEGSENLQKENEDGLLAEVPSTQLEA